MLVPAINDRNITFKSKFPKFNDLSSNSAIIIRGENSHRFSSLTDAFRSIHNALNRLSSESASENAQYSFMELQDKFGIKSVSKSIEDGIVVKNGEKDLSISVHGEDSLRFRDLDTKTGEVVESFYCANKKLVKTDTKNKIPESLEFYYYNEYKAEKHLAEFMKRFDFADFLILKIRIALGKPEIQAELNTRTGANALANINRGIIEINPHSANTAIPVDKKEQKPLQPKKLLSYYEKMLIESAKKKKQAQQNQNLTTSAESKEIKQSKSAVPKTTETTEPENTVTKTKDLSKSENPQKTNKIKRTYKKRTSEKTTPVSKKRFITAQKDKGVLSSTKLEIFEDIYDEFSQAYEQLSTLNNSITRSKVKNGYGEKLAKGITGSKELRFIGIGKKGEDYSVNIIKYNYENHLVIKITDKSKQDTYYILNSQNQLMKTPPLTLKFGKQQNNGQNLVKYYSQDEINSIDTEKILSPLRTELKNYNKYIENRISKISSKKAYYTNSNGYGTLESEHEKIENIQGLVQKYRENARKLYSNKRNKYTEVMGFKPTKSTDLIMRDVGRDKETIRLSFPQYNGKKGMKIQVLDESNNVERVFYIMNDKLVKFESDKLHSYKHGSRGIYYHSQEEIEKSGVRYYIDAVQKHLEPVDDKYNEVINAPVQKSFKRQFTKEKNKFLTEIQTSLNDFISNFDNGLSANGDVIRLTGKAFYDIKQNTTKTLEELKTKLQQIFGKKN